MMVARWIGIALLLTLSSVASGVMAEEIEGVEFQDQVNVRDVKLKLHSVGLLRYMVFIKAYVAGLYLGPDVTPGDVLEDRAKRLEIHYFYAISKEDFQNSTEASILKNVGPEPFESLRTQVERFNALYRDITPNDRYALTYLPGVGTELKLNGETLGVVEGADFGNAVFSIWLGDAAIDTALKESLLGTP